MFLQSINVYRAFTTAYSYIRMVGCMTHNLYCIPAYYLINLILLPLYYISIDHYARVEIILYNWLLYIVSSWSWCGGLVVHEHGDDIYSLRNGRLRNFFIFDLYFFLCLHFCSYRSKRTNSSTG